MIEPKTGELNRRVSLFGVKLNPIEQADQAVERSPFLQVWAKIEVIGGSVYWDNVQTEEAVTNRIFIRQVRGQTRPQDLPRIFEIFDGSLTYRAKRVTDCNGAGRFTLIECEVLRAETPDDFSQV